MLPAVEVLQSADRLWAHRLLESPPINLCSVDSCADDRELKDDACDTDGEKLLKREQSSSNSCAVSVEWLIMLAESISDCEGKLLLLLLLVPLLLESTESLLNWLLSSIEFIMGSGL